MHFVIQAIVVRKGNVEGVLTWNQSGREISGASLGVGIVVATKVFLPVLVPGRFVIGSGIVGGRFLADPENSCGDVLFPRVNGGLLNLEGIFGSRHHGNL